MQIYSHYVVLILHSIFVKFHIPCLISHLPRSFLLIVLVSVVGGERNWNALWIYMKLSNTKINQFIEKILNILIYLEFILLFFKSLTILYYIFSSNNLGILWKLCYFTTIYFFSMEYLWPFAVFSSLFLSLVLSLACSVCVSEFVCV